jgi:hypothetical protein
MIQELKQLVKFKGRAADECEDSQGGAAQAPLALEWAPQPDPLPDSLPDSLATQASSATVALPAARTQPATPALPATPAAPALPAAMTQRAAPALPACLQQPASTVEAKPLDVRALPMRLIAYGQAASSTALDAKAVAEETMFQRQRVRCRIWNGTRGKLAAPSMPVPPSAPTRKPTQAPTQAPTRKPRQVKMQEPTQVQTQDPAPKPLQRAQTKSLQRHVSICSSGSEHAAFPPEPAEPSWMSYTELFISKMSTTVLVAQQHGAGGREAAIPDHRQAQLHAVAQLDHTNISSVGAFFWC